MPDQWPEHNRLHEWPYRALGAFLRSHFAEGNLYLLEAEPRNIIMLHPEAHNIVDQGTQEDRDKHPEWNWKAWDAEVELAKEEYDEYVINNNL
jgi:hypothetical protein